MKANSSKLLTYKEYLNELNKKSLTSILDAYHLEYQKNWKKDKCIDLILNNINNIVNYTLELFQSDEYINIKLLIKKKGHVKVQFNNLLLSFLETLQKRNLVISLGDNEFYMPKELLNIYKRKIKSKKTIQKIKQNTAEYNLILGFLDAYGVVDFEYFYFNYTKIYKLTKEDVLTRLNNLSGFFNEFKIYKDKTSTYLASINIKTTKECKEYAKRLGNYAVYTNEELVDIHTLKFLSRNKAYKKLVKFITHHYDISKGSFKVINKFILMPYLIENQKNSEAADKVLSALIDKYFEFNNEKHKNKIMELVKSNALDYPRWNLKGSIERK